MKMQRIDVLNEFAMLSEYTVYKRDMSQDEDTNLSANGLKKGESCAERLQPSIVLDVQVSTDRGAAAEETNSKVGDSAIHIVDCNVTWRSRPIAEGQRRVCVCVCVCVCVYVFMYLCIGAYICVCVCVRVC